MTIDRNRIKLELLNFRNHAEIYADSRNLITEYERNDNKITAAERHDIRLTKLEKNAKAKIPFKELFDRYAELKASDTNPFSTDVFALSLIERRNPLVKQAFEILGTERVRELKYNQTQIRRIYSLWVIMIGVPVSPKDCVSTLNSTFFICGN